MILSIKDFLVKDLDKNITNSTWAIALDIQGFPQFLDASLLHKLKSYGISGQIFGLILSFRNSRRLRVTLDRKSSQEYPVNAGLTQSSIQGSRPYTLPTIH